MKFPFFQSKKVDKPKVAQQIASTGDGRDITRPFLSALATADDSVLQRRGNHDLTIYREVLNDDEVKSTFGQRQDALVSREWQVDAGGENPIDIEAADFLREQLKHIGFDRVTRQMHYGVFYGYAVAELIYAKRGEQLIIDEIKVRDRRRFRFTPKGELRLLTPQNMQEGEPCPAPYFWHFATGADHDDEPYGMGLAHWLYWPTLFKRNGLKFWLIFLDKFAMPTVVGKYNESATQEQKNKLLQLIHSIQTDSGMIVPESMMLELLSAARSGTADYETLYRTMNESIRRVVVGQISTSGGAAKGIGGDESLQDKVFTAIVKSDADVICESFNQSVATWLTELNFPGAAVPRVYRLFAEPDDLDLRASRDKTLTEIGYRPTLANVQKNYGDEYEFVNTPQAGNNTELDKPIEFAETIPNNTVSDISELALNMNAQLAPITFAQMQLIKSRIDAAESLESIRGELEQLAVDLTIDKQASIIADALSIAHLAGRADVIAESQS